MSNFPGRLVHTADYPEGGKARCAIITCIDPRLNLSHHELMHDVMRIEPASYYTQRIAGATPGLDKHFDLCNINWYKVLKLLVDNDLNKLVLAPHTKCAADGVKYTFSTPEEDYAHQQSKIAQATSEIQKYAEALKHPITVEPFIVGLEDRIEFRYLGSGQLPFEMAAVAAG